MASMVQNRLWSAEVITYLSRNSLPKGTRLRGDE